MEPDPVRAQLSAALAHVRDVFAEAGTAAEAVSRLMELARELAPLAAGAGISIVDENGVCTTVAATDPAVVEADALQFELGSGPCLRAWDTVSPQYVSDTTTDPRWRESGRAVAEAGIRSVLSVPLVIGGQEIGALQVYATEPEAFTEYEEHLLGLLAGPVAVLLGTDRVRRLDDTLREAVTDRDRVERAVGVLMERSHQAESTARSSLLDTSRARGKTLAQTADHVLDDTNPPV
jgi:GAF domain-containing protein